MSNNYYNHGNAPATGSNLSSATIRAEFDSIAAGLDKLPTVTSNGNKIVKVNSGGTALTVSAVISDDGTNATVSGDLTVAGGNLGIDADSLHTLPNVAADTFTLNAATQTLTNKTVNLTSNTLTGTLAQFNTAVSDADIASIAGTETLTNKTLNLTSNTLSGTLAQFNTALSDADFASLTTTQTLTNKTVVVASNTVTTAASGNLAATELNAALAELQGDIDTREYIVRQTTVATGSSLTPNINTTDMLIQANTEATGTLTINNPTGTLGNFRRLILRVKSTNAHTLSWGANYQGSDSLALPSSLTGGTKTDYMGFMYNTDTSKWQFVAKIFGF